MATFWHGSAANIRGGTLVPSPGKHGAYVWAAKSRGSALLFARKKTSGYASMMWGAGGQAIVIEQFEGDLEARYDHVGYLYRIADSAKCFTKRPWLTFAGEYVCDRPVEYVEKVRVPNVLDALSEEGVAVIRYKRVRRVMISLLDDSAATDIPRYQSADRDREARSSPANAANGVLFEGANEMYSTLEQAALSFIIGGMITAVIDRDSVVMVSHLPRRTWAGAARAVVVNARERGTSRRIRHNIYELEGRGRVVRRINLTRGQVLGILGRIEFVEPKIVAEDI